MAAKPISKPLSMANAFLISSSPAILAAKSPLQFPLPLKPFRLNISASFNTSLYLSSSFSLRKFPNSKSSVTVVAAQHEEDNTLVLQKEEGEGEEGEGQWEDGNEEAGYEQASGTGASDWEEEADGGAAAGGGGGYPEPSEEAKVFVGNLPYEVDSEKLAHLFEQAGVVEISEVIYNRENDQSRGFAFVTMSTVEEAEKAVEMFNRYDLDGRLLTVNKAAPRGSRPERPAGQRTSRANTVYVGNLPWDVDESRLEQVFSEHGKVLEVRVVSDRDTGRSRGFGFVTMSTVEEMNDAIQNLDGQSLGGRSIRVNAAEDRPRRSF